VLHQPNPAACGFWYLDAAAAFLRISGKLSKTKQKQNKTNKQSNLATKPKNKKKKTEEKSCNSYRSEQQEQTLQ
jgi:hypothetical protein